jgi:uncharacterized protein YndB with AHSA1/START domain
MEATMALQVIEHERTTSAPPETVFRLLVDGSTWPDWSPLGSFELVEPGDGSPEGVGAVRIFRTGRHSTRERVVEVQPTTRFSYELVSGMAIRDYRAEVTLWATEGGTVIRWRSTFRAKVPGTGAIYQKALGSFIGKTVDGLAAKASASVLG